MSEIKVTKSMYYAQIREVLVAADADASLIDFVDAQVDALATAAEKAKERRAKKAAEKEDPILDAVQSALTEEPQTAYDLMEAVQVEGTTVAKVRARLTKLVAAGVAEKEPTKEGMTYKLAH